MKVLAIDPGCERSAYVILEGGRPAEAAKLLNGDLLRGIGLIGGLTAGGLAEKADRCVIEMVASYGMAVGKEVFETVVFVGRLMERWEAVTGKPADRLFRRDVKLAICHHPRATDSNIRTELIDRFGPGKDKAIGTKKAPGPLYGYKADVWAALALGITFEERAKEKPGPLDRAVREGFSDFNDGFDTKAEG